MATTRHELTVTVSGDKINKVLFVNDDQLGSTLTEVRHLLINQGVDIFEEYSFLTANGNVLSTVQDNMLTLKDITTKLEKRNVEEEVQNEEERDMLDIEFVKGRTVSTLDLLQISIHPTVRNSVDGLEDGKEGSDDDKCSQPSQSSQRKCKCPFREYKDIFNIHDYMNGKTAFRLMLALIFAIVCTLFMITCTIHMAATAWGVLEQGGYLAGQPPASTPDAITELKLKLQEIELTTAYKMAELEKRLGGMYSTHHRNLMEEMQELKGMLSGTVNFEHRDEKIAQRAELNGKISFKKGA